MQSQQRHDEDDDSPEVVEENQRIARNLRGLIRAVESIHNSASTVVGDTRSTVWGGSVMGEPLTDEQYGDIRDWIPPLPGAMEEDEQSEPSSSNPVIISPAGLRTESSDKDSDDSDIERHLTNWFRELALGLKEMTVSKAAGIRICLFIGNREAITDSEGVLYFPILRGELNRFSATIS